MRERQDVEYALARYVVEVEELLAKGLSRRTAISLVAARHDLERSRFDDEAWLYGLTAKGLDVNQQIG